MRRSAGLLLHRMRAGRLEVLLVHPGGPFWARKDAGAWTIPKGEPGEGEPLLAAARRELVEETGFPADGPALPLGEVRQAGGKVVHAWAVRGDADPDALRSNPFELEWPPHSGRVQAFPEADRAAWFTLEEAERRILPAQVPLLERLRTALERPRRVVSGGQTGADRAAWDAARALGIAIGGWGPCGRAAEDGRVPDRYGELPETPSHDPAERTAWNVRDSDATLIVSHGRLAGGSLRTREEAALHGRPWLHLDLDLLGPGEAEARLDAWLDAVAPGVLNVAGPRASEDPRIAEAVETLLRATLARRG